MSKKETKAVKADKKYSKSAFVDASKTNKERFEYKTLLEDGKTYSKQDAEKIVSDWKKEVVK